VHRLPQANRTLIRALSAFLIGIVNNADVTKMSVRNVGIVFSPTLNIPAPVFAMFLTEFDAIFGAAPDESVPMPEVSVTEPLTPEEIRSPRRQMFSELPTPSYATSTFPKADPTYEQVLHDSHAENDTGFIPLQPSYETATFTPGPFGATHHHGSITMPGPEYGTSSRNLGPSSMQATKARRRESSMLLMGHNPLRKSSMLGIREDREDTTLVEEESAFE